MVIKRSSAREVAGLLEDLEQGDENARQAAVARLSVIGTRAVDGLIRVAGSPASPAVRSAALAALEAIGDPRGIDAAFAILDEGDGALALPAAAVLRQALESPRGDEVLDRLVSIALDPARADRPRLAALEALQGLPAKVLAPIWRKLNDDPSAAVRGAVAGAGPLQEMDPVSAVESAAGGELPEDPDTVRRWVASAGGQVSLPILHRLIEAIRAREASAPDPAGRGAWTTARAAVHVALAERGSRVALYDLRETLERNALVPVEMLAALERIGDASCLEPIASAYARLSSPAEAGGAAPAPPGSSGSSTWWRQHLATAFRAIAAREKLPERHAIVRRIRSRWPDAGLDLFGPPRR